MKNGRVQLLSEFRNINRKVDLRPIILKKYNKFLLSLKDLSMTHHYTLIWDNNKSC